MNLDNAIALVWVSAITFFTILIIGTLALVSSAVLHFRSKTAVKTEIQKQTSIIIDLDKIPELKPED